MARITKSNIEKAFAEKSLLAEQEATAEIEVAAQPEESDFNDDTIDNEMRVVEDLRAALSGTEVPKDAQVRLYRRKEGEKLVYLHSWPAAEFSQDQIQSLFGGGRYQIKAYAINPRTGRVGIFINREFECENPVGGLKTATAAAPVPDALAAKLDKLIELQLQPKKEDGNALDMALALMDRFQKMQPAPAPPPAQTSLKEMMETMLMMREFSAELAPKAEAEPSDLQTLANVAGGLMQAINQVPPSKTIAPTHYPQIDQNISTGIGVDQAQEPRDSMTTTFMMRMAAVEMLGAAKAGEPVKAFAEKAIGLVNTDLLLAFIDAPDWFERILQLSPEAVSFRQWYENLRQEILTQFPPEPEDSNVNVPASATR